MAQGTSGDILLVGASFETWIRVREQAEFSLGPCRYVSVEYLENFEDSAVSIPGRESLQFVIVMNEYGLSREEITQGCAILADVLQRHPRKPEVIFVDPKLYYLIDVFRPKVRVAFGLPYVLNAL